MRKSNSVYKKIIMSLFFIGAAFSGIYASDDDWGGPDSPPDAPIDEFILFLVIAAILLAFRYIIVGRVRGKNRKRKVLY